MLLLKWYCPTCFPEKVGLFFCVCFAFCVFCEVSVMTTVTIREQLHRQIDNFPDDVVEQIADFTLFVMARRQIASSYADWDSSQWQEFSLGQLFRENHEIEYTLRDAQEIYNP